MLRLLILVVLNASLLYAACPDGYSELYGACYTVYSSSRNYLAAESHCVSDGGRLASIHDESTQKVLAAHIPRAQVALIGLQCTGRSNAKCVWSDGTPFDYNGFNSGSPNLAYGECVTLSQSDGLWYSTACEAQQTASICKLPYANYTMSTTTEPVTYAPFTCPSVQLFDNYGTVYSPGFPLRFPANTKCEYILDGPTGSTIIVRFPYFNTDNGTTLNIYDGISETNPSYTLSGSSPNRSYSSTGNVVKLIFQTGNLPNGFGWQADFSYSLPVTTISFPNTTLTTTTAYPTTITRKHCKDTHSYVGLSIFSPNYPGAYDANTECNYYVQSLFGQNIELDFYSIDTVKDIDVLTIYDGGSTNDPILGTVSGHYGWDGDSQIFKSSGAWITVNFNVRSTSVHGGGWWAQVTVA